MKKPAKRWLPGTVVYGQGSWPVRVELDEGDTLAYQPLPHEGHTYPKRTLHAARDLFSRSRNANWPAARQPKVSR